MPLKAGQHIHLLRRPPASAAGAHPGEPTNQSSTMEADPPPPASALMEELVEEVLLRFPLADPASLVRAALVCRRWRRIVTGPRFRRRFRDLHLHRGGSSSPPMLGFLANSGPGTRFVPTSTFRPGPARAGGGGLLLGGWLALDVRALLSRHTGRGAPIDCELAVWDPATGRRTDLPLVARLIAQQHVFPVLSENIF